MWMLVFMLMPMLMLMGMWMSVRVRVRMRMGMRRHMFVRFVRVRVGVGMGAIFQVDVELHAFDAGFRAAGDVEVVTGKVELGQVGLQRVKINAEINQGAEKHIPTDAAEDIEVKEFHRFGLGV